SCWPTERRRTEDPRCCIQDRATFGRKDRLFAGVGIPSRHKRRSSQHCCRTWNAHHVSDGPCIDARFWKLVTVSAPQSGFHVIANGRSQHDDAICCGALRREWHKADLGRVSYVVRFSNRPSGSSTFRLTTTPVSMSLTGSRFSSLIGRLGQALSD